MHKWVAGRKEKGLYHYLFMELLPEDPNRYRRFAAVYIMYLKNEEISVKKCYFRCLRMDVGTFECLLTKVTPIIQKQGTHLRENIPSSERLSVTLRHSATSKRIEFQLKVIICQNYVVIKYIFTYAIFHRRNSRIIISRIQA